MAERTQRLQSAKDRLADIDRQLDALRIDRQLAQREIELLADGPGPRASRTDRIVEIVERLGEATPAQVGQQLELLEGSVNPAKVRATLAYLLKQGRLIRPVPGRYRAVGAEGPGLP